MAVYFEITWDGTEPGLAEHRLRIRSFGDALVKLSMALQWTASAILTNSQSPTHGRSGQLAEEAKYIDIELESIKDGCARIGLVGSYEIPVGKNYTLSEDLLKDASKKLLDDIEKESHGQASSYRVRQFLRALPSSLNKQRYRLWIDGVEYKTVEFAETTISPENRLLGGLQHVLGFIVGVGFVPGPPEIRVRIHEKNTIQTFEATTEQVNHALSMRGKMVEVLGLVRQGGRNPKLLWIRADSLGRELTPEERLQHIVEAWDETLRRLAK